MDVGIKYLHLSKYQLVAQQSFLLFLFQFAAFLKYP